MNRKTLKAAAVIGAALFVAGLILVFAAVPIGSGAADRAIQANGGSMDTERYYFIMRSTALSAQIGGTVCALVGGLGAILCGCRRGG